MAKSQRGAKTSFFGFRWPNPFARKIDSRPTQVEFGYISYNVHQVYQEDSVNWGSTVH